MYTYFLFLFYIDESFQHTMLKVLNLDVSPELCLASSENVRPRRRRAILWLARSFSVGVACRPERFDLDIPKNS